MSPREHLSQNFMDATLKSFGSEEGVVVPIATLLIIAIAIIAFLLFYPGYTHREVEEAERKHMESVRESFLKIQKKVYQMSEGEAFSEEIQMSCGHVPLVPDSGMAGVLSVFPLTDDKYGIIEFKARNQYYPSQTYAFEGGAVILVQKVDLICWPPEMVTAWDLGDNCIRVNVENIIIVQPGVAEENSRISRRGTGRVEVRCENSCYVVSPAPRDNENQSSALSPVVPNRKNVVIDLRGKVKYENAWKSYLKGVAEELNAKGYNVIDNSDNLWLNIQGREPVENDICYYERVRKIEVGVY